MHFSVPQNRRGRTTAPDPRKTPTSPHRGPFRVDFVFLVSVANFYCGLLSATATAPAHLNSNRHGCPDVPSKNRAIITANFDAADPRARGVGWFAGFGFALREPSLVGGMTKNKSRGRTRTTAKCGALCSAALADLGTHPIVSGSGGPAENRNAPNDAD